MAKSPAPGTQVSPFIGTKAKLPCVSCKKMIGPRQGQMMRNGEVFCEECLNTGAYLHAGSYANPVDKGTLEDYTSGKLKGRKPAAHFKK